MSQVAGPVEIHRHIYITMDQSIRIYQQSGSICESQEIQGATLILSQGTNSEHPSIKDCDKKKDVWNLWFFKPYPRGNDGTYDQISVLWNFRIYILFKTIQLISTRKLLDSSPSQSQASAVAKSISPSFRSLTNMKRKHLHKPHKPHKVAPFLMHASGLQCIFWVSQAMPSQCVHW